MHAYRWDTAKLSRKLEAFAGGQLRIEDPKEKVVMQIQIEYCGVPKLSQKIIQVIPLWIAGRKFLLESGQPEEYWAKVEPRLGQTSINLEFTTYYFQRERENVKGKANRKERVKFWTKQGEICRLYQKGDPLILVEKDGRFVPSTPPDDKAREKN